MTMVQVAVWICPRCEQYYAASHAGDLNAQWNTDEKNRRTFQRSRCPTCNIARVEHHVEIEVERQE